MRVLVALLHVGNCRIEVAQLLLQIQQDTRYKVDIKFFTHVPGESNRNRICKYVVESDYDYVVMIDDDNPPLKNPLDLIRLEKDIIGLPTPIIKKEKSWNVGKNFGTKENPDIRCYLIDNKQEGLEEVDFVGSGCLVLSRKVLEEIKAPFMRVWDEDGIAVKGQDIAFCERAIDKGYKVYVHWSYICSHFKEIDLLI